MNGLLAILGHLIFVAQSLSAPAGGTLGVLGKNKLEFDGKRMSGRPRAADKAAILQAIHEYKVTSPYKIAEKLNCGKSTIYRRLEQISQNEIDEALGLVSEAGTLKSAEEEWDVFRRFPEVKKYIETLLYVRKDTATYSMKRVRMLFRVCVLLKRKPSALTPEMAKELLIRIRKVEVKIGEYDFRMGMRVWFGYKGINGTLLTNLGLSSDNSGEDRSHLKFNREQRAALMRVVENWTRRNWSNGKITIPFADEPYLGAAMRFLPKFLYYTGTRIGREGNDNETGALNVLWENLTIQPDMIIIRLIDKGKRGGIEWFKQLIGDGKRYFDEFMKAIQGLPKPKRIFPFKVREVRTFFKAAYREAGIPKELWSGLPLHIWRHTAAQDLLHATHFNYELSAQILGWENTEVMKRSYGKMPDEERTTGLMIAMGLPAEREKREFLF
jgi:integrase